MKINKKFSKYIYRNFNIDLSQVLNTGVVMTKSWLNAKSTTGTRTRVTDVSPFSGMCPICIKECPVLCEISKSAFRGREVLYPSPEYFGESTAAANKEAKNNWDGLAIGAAISGTIQTIGENVCGMDQEAQITNGKVTYSKDMEYRVKIYKEW